MEKRTSPVLFSFVFLLLAACVDRGPEFIEAEQVTGYIPIYESSLATKILMVPPRAVNKPGKIYLHGKYLLINEQNRGIHVFDNSDPSVPLNLGFLQLLGNTDLAIKDSVLYADHLGDLVAVRVNDFGTIVEKARLPFSSWTRGIPPPPGFYFQCVEAQKGIVVDWKEAEVKNPQCYALP
jgi:hypothetical protein